MEEADLIKGVSFVVVDQAILKIFGLDNTNGSGDLSDIDYGVKLDDEAVTLQADGDTTGTQTLLRTYWGKNTTAYIEANGLIHTESDLQVEGTAKLEDVTVENNYSSLTGAINLGSTDSQPYTSIDSSSLTIVNATGSTKIINFGTNSSANNGWIEAGGNIHAQSYYGNSFNGASAELTVGGSYQTQVALNVSDGEYWNIIGYDMADPQNPAPKWGVKDTGDAEFNTVISQTVEAVEGTILTSPGGTRYKITVDDSGNLGTTAA